MKYKNRFFASLESQIFNRTTMSEKISWKDIYIVQVKTASFQYSIGNLSGRFSIMFSENSAKISYTCKTTKFTDFCYGKFFLL